MSQPVMTVRGPVDPTELGFGLTHEHLRIDLISIFPASMLAFDFQLIDEELISDEVRRFQEAVGSAWPGRPWIVDVRTDRRMGRDPATLRRMADTLDLDIVMGCGRYRERWYEPDFGTITTRQLADQLTREIEQGAEDTGIRPGIIGELGADRDFVSPAEERVLRAAAVAHQRTGLPVTLHARFGQVGLAQLDILEDAGVRPDRVIVGHTDTDPDLDYHEAIAGRGAWVQYDTIRGRVPLVVERRLRYVLGHDDAASCRSCCCPTTSAVCRCCGRTAARATTSCRGRSRACSGTPVSRTTSWSSCSSSSRVPS